TGQSIWQLRRPTTYKCKYRYSDGPYSTPIIDEESVYAISAEGIMRCVDAVSGMPRWEKSLWDEFGMEENLFAVAGSPLLWRDRLIFNAGGTNGDAGIVAIDKRSGKTMWTATDHRAGYATPIAATIHGQDYVFVVTFEGLVALDPNDGRVFWEIRQRPTKPDSINATSPLVDGDLVLMVTGPGPGAMCVRVLPNGEYAEVWRDRRVLDSQFNNLALVNGFVYGYTTSRQGGADFRCVELATGKLRWQWSSALERGSSLVVGQRLLLLGEHGHLAMLDVNSNKAAPRCITDHQVLEGPCYSAPAFHHGMLFVRNERWIRCYDFAGL
ncbi:MAG: PQQ-binding-like beta-propeller repeat protein, partial [Planctomycetales bacterium]|nr:PQQ-binding-like beta-propeller repeat protein [Planctomycetales bacterium]